MRLQPLTQLSYVYCTDMRCRGELVCPQWCPSSAPHSITNRWSGRTAWQRVIHPVVPVTERIEELAQKLQALPSGFGRAAKPPRPLFENEVTFPPFSLPDPPITRMFFCVHR